MLGNGDVNKANVLAKQYPQIFHDNVRIADVYLKILNNLKMIDHEFKREAHEGGKYSRELLDFLKTKTQFKSITNLYLVMEDVIRFAQVASHQNNAKVKNYSNEILNDSKKILKHIDSVLFSGFEYVGFAALSELNISSMQEKNKENITPESSKEKKLRG